MAKRSDFAQKLLDDLRLRKERMATPQNSDKSTRIRADAYSTAKQIPRGSRDMKTQGNLASRARNTHTSGSNRLPYNEESSNQVVSYSRGQSSHHIGDLSMALAFALENGGKLRSTDFSRNSYMLNFLHQISRGSINFGKMEKRSSSDRFQPNYPAISHLHLKEISKGAEKLNQILKTCSNGIKFNKYSVDIGRELLKGAMDLEESLRMLVNLQEASEYMISSKSKTRITLLEDAEDEDNKKPMHEQKQLILPRFSFDKISHNSHNIQGVKRSSQKQSLPALNYLQEPSNFLDINQALIPQNVADHRKSANYGTAATLPEQKNNSSSKQGKARMSNVIAKLMGIDDILEDSHSKSITQKGLSSKTRMNSSQLTGEGSTKKVESKTMENQKQMEADKRSVIKNPKVASEFIKTKSMPTHSTKLEEGINLTRKNLNGIRSMTILAKGDNTMDSQQSSIDQSQLNVTHQKVYLERGRKQKDVRQIEQKETEKGKSRGSLLKFGSQQKELQPIKISKSAVPEGYKENILQFDKRYVNKSVSENQKKSLTSIELQNPQVLKKAETREVQHNENQGENKNGKQNLQDRKKQFEITSRNLSKPTDNFLGLRKKQLDNDYPRQRKQISKEAFNVIQTDVFPNSRYQEDPARDEISYKSSGIGSGIVNALTDRSSEPSYSQKGQEAEFRKVNASVQVGTEQKQSYELATKKAQTTRIHESEASQKIDDESTRRNGTMHNSAKPLKQKNPITKEAKTIIIHENFNAHSGGDQAKVSGFKEVEATVVGPNRPVTSIKQATVPEKLPKEVKQVATAHGADSNEFQNLKKPQVPSNGNLLQYQKTDTMVTSNPLELILGRDEQLNRINITSNAPTAVTATDQKHISCPQQSYHRSSFTKSRKQGALTESESCLKQILISSELFLKIAEALFKINIPTGILEIGIYDFEDEESTVTLESSLEIMKRKGTMQELINHPCTSISMRFMRIRSLDGLVKQLHDDFEMLKFYGREGRNECSLEDYLPKMLENDLHDRNPDLNCMWDLGWNERIFSFIERDDVIRGIEKHVLGGLVDEITRDLFHILGFQEKRK